jgi:hypothetical protein
MISKVYNDNKDPESTLLRQVQQEDYDPYQKADFLEADRHRRAHLVRQVGKAMKDPNCDKCKCCGFPIEAEEFPLSCKMQEISELGSGFPLFFEFSKIILLIFTLGSFLVSIPCIIGNIKADRSKDWKADKDSWVIKISLGNQGDSESIFPFWQSVLHVVFMILLIFIYHVSCRWIDSKDRSLDITAITAKDYTVHAYGLGLDVNEEEVQNFFEQSGRVDKKPAKIVKVVFAYKIKEYVEKIKRLEDLAETLTSLEIGKNPTQGICVKKMRNKGEIQMEMKSIEEQIRKFELELPAGIGRNLLTGQAFVTFDTQEDARAVEMKFGKQWAFRVWRNTFKSIFGIVTRSKQKFKPESIIAWIANEPNDIFWENLEVDFKGRAFNLLKTYLATAFAISITFGMIYGMKILGKQEKEDSDNNSQNDSWKLRILSIWPSIIIVIINFILSRLIRYFTSFEKPHTLTAYNISVSTKLTLAMFFNSALIALIVNYDWEKDWFTRGGLVYDITYILISNAIVTPLVYYLSPVVCLHKYRIRKVKKTEYISQHDANILIENPSVDMGQRFANLNKTVLLVFCYAPLVPVSHIFGIIAVVFEYWTFKYLLLRRHSWPQRLSGDLAKAMLNILPWAVLLYSIMNYVFMLSLNPDQSEMAFIWMIVMLGYTFLPLEMITDCFMKKDLSIWTKYSQVKYEDVALTFMQDYDTMNPITSSAGHKRYAELLLKKNLLDEEKFKELNRKYTIENQNPTKALKKLIRSKKHPKFQTNLNESSPNSEAVHPKPKKRLNFRTEARKLTKKSFTPVLKQQETKPHAILPQPEEKIQENISEMQVSIPENPKVQLPEIARSNRESSELITNHPAYEFNGGSYYYRKYWQHKKLYN